MKIPDNDYQILRLTDRFYQTYPDPPCKEILRKKERPYACILFQTHYDFFICVPFRTDISHRYAWHFRDSQRAKAHRSGIDYTKMVIIDKIEYLDNKGAVVDRDEYIETVKNIEHIKKEALLFLEEYILHMQGKRTLCKEEFDRRYRFSPLKYFKNEIGI